MKCLSNNGRVKFLYFKNLTRLFDNSPSHCNIIIFISLPSLIVIFLLFASETLYCQDSTEVIPDGTEGLIMKVSKKDTVIKPGKWNEFDGPVSTLKFGFAFLYEYASYIQDDASKEQIDMEPKFMLRDFRFLVSGKLKTKRLITWKAGVMYDAASYSWLIRETGIMFGVPELSGHIFVGRTKEGFSLSKVMSGYAVFGMERPMANDFLPILSDGVKYMGFLPKSRLLWNVGVYNDWLSKEQSFSTYAWLFSLRAGWMPVYSKKKNLLLHIAGSYRYGQPEGGEIRVRSRPEAYPAPYFVETPKFKTDHSNSYGWEAYFSAGSLILGTEYYFQKYTSLDKNNPLFQGGEVMVSYIFTGEIHPYSTVSGIFSFVNVKKSVFEGGPGAWEVILRGSGYDLNGGTITGGKFWRITPMVNWYLSNFARLELAYGYGVLDRFELKGATQFFQSRFQLFVN
jgi:phosphate-selective porin OprO and OprP